MNLSKPEITVSFSKVKIFFFLITYIAMFAYICVAFYMKQLYFQSFGHWLFIHLLCWGLSYYLGVSIIALFGLLFESNPAILINHVGVYYQVNTFINFQIPWTYITDIRTTQIKFTKYPVLVIDYNPRFFSHISFLNKLIFYPKLLFRPKRIKIDVPLLKTSYRELFSALTLKYDGNKSNDSFDLNLDLQTPESDKSR